MIFGLSKEERRARHDQEQAEKVRRSKPTRIFAWYPVRREEDLRWVWLEHVWRVILVHRFGGVYKKEYSSSEYWAGICFDRWKDILRRS